MYTNQLSCAVNRSVTASPGSSYTSSNLFPSKSERSPRDKWYQPKSTRQQQRRRSWAACDWEDFGGSREKFSEVDLYEESEVSDSDTIPHRVQDGDGTLGGNFGGKLDCSCHVTISPRPGSLLELILQDDAPVISGCDAPNMRLRGSMREKIITKDDEELTPEIQLDISAMFLDRWES